MTADTWKPWLKLFLWLVSSLVQSHLVASRITLEGSSHSSWALEFWYVTGTVKPVSRGTVSSGHPVLSDQLSKSRICFPIISVIFTSILIVPNGLFLIIFHRYWTVLESWTFDAMILSQSQSRKYFLSNILYMVNYGIDWHRLSFFIKTLNLCRNLH